MRQNVAPQNLNINILKLSVPSRHSQVPRQISALDRKSTLTSEQQIVQKGALPTIVILSKERYSLHLTENSHGFVFYSEVVSSSVSIILRVKTQYSRLCRCDAIKLTAVSHFNNIYISPNI